MQPAGPPIKPAVPCLCRVEHAADGSGSRVFRSPECPQHAHLLKPQTPPQPLPHGLADMVTEPVVLESDSNRDAPESRRAESFAETRERVARESKP